RLGHPVLREKSRPLSSSFLAKSSTQTLIDNMIETMYEYHGGGLAAPQVHESLLLTVIESQGERGRIPLTVLVNPKVTVLGTNPDADKVEDWEGCLSIPELRGRVPRFRKLRVEALDRKGGKLNFIAEGFFARVVQHEYDHLMGHVYLDRMPDLHTLTHLDEMRRYWLPEESEESEEPHGTESPVTQVKSQDAAS
ncbi:MAG TPA: peptide deformylase, partial [Terriglobia bacterium]|nr:peptide deformylase [Terriglobia bacterium]